MAFERGEGAIRRAQSRLHARLDRPRRVLLRDFLIFELKLLLDGLKGLVISWAAFLAVIVDLIRPGGRDYKMFYRVLSVGEKADSWLSLYGASERAAEDPEGLFGVSREGSRTLLGQLEHLVHRMVVGDHVGEEELYGAGGPARTPSQPGPTPSEPPAPAGRSGFEELRVRPEPPA